jgi:Mn-dependent DtxR family transcriptional regulator
MFLEELIIEFFERGESNAFEIAYKLGIEPDIVIEIIDRLQLLGLIKNREWS